MSEDIAARVMSVCKYIVESGCTVREAADVYGVSKSTIHKDCTERVRELDIVLFDQVRDVLEHNLAIRHLRGGAATKKKFSHFETQPAESVL